MKKANKYIYLVILIYFLKIEIQIGQEIDCCPHAYNNIISNTSRYTSIDSALLFPEKVIILDVDIFEYDYENVNIVHIPGKIKTLRSLEEVFIRGNIKKLPRSFGYLTKLHKISLRGNKIKYLPKSFRKLKNLECLFLTNNKFKKFPKVIFKLYNLTYLDLSFNNIIKIPRGIIYLHKLKCLDISHCNLQGFPTEILNNLELERLELSDRKIGIVPDSIYKLKKLKMLMINNADSLWLPDEMQKMKIEYLELSYDHLKEIPQVVFKMTGLRSLELYYNNLQYIPDEITNLVNLRDLNIFPFSKKIKCSDKVKDFLMKFGYSF